MAAFIFLYVFLAFVYPSWSQIAYNEKSNTLLCSKPGGAYCIHGSLIGPTIVSCVGDTKAEIRSCNIELSAILPQKYKDFAVCYESSPRAGDAVCAFNGTGYSPSTANSIIVPQTILCKHDFDYHDVLDTRSAREANQESALEGMSPEEADPDGTSTDPHNFLSERSLMSPNHPFLSTSLDQGHIYSTPSMSYHLEKAPLLASDPVPSHTLISKANIPDGYPCSNPWDTNGLTGVNRVKTSVPVPTQLVAPSTSSLTVSSAGVWRSLSLETGSSPTVTSSSLSATGVWTTESSSGDSSMVFSGSQTWQPCTTTAAPNANGAKGLSGNWTKGFFVVVVAVWLTVVSV